MESATATEAIVQTGEHRDHTQARGEERRRALRVAWNPTVDRRLRGRAVLLVDDIVTTGTTLKTAAELLREQGVADVYGVALLHTGNSIWPNSRLSLHSVQRPAAQMRRGPLY